MIIRIHGLNVRTRPAAIALAAAALAVGAVFVAFGIVLLLSLAFVGTVVGAGVLAFRALTGRGTGRLRSAQPELDLDPALEVLPAESPAQPQPHKLTSSQAHKLTSLSKTVVLLGATGLVGSHCLRLLAADSAFGRVVVLTRRALPRELARGNIEPHVVDFGNLGAHAALFHVDQIICTLGTTIKQAGTQDAFRAVDYHYPLTAARLGRERGATHFLLVSSLGANPRSRVFYSRVKGELESAILARGYRSVTIVRPSLLLGPRAEYRMGEQIAKRLAFLVPGKYKPVDAHAVAAALVRAAKEDAPGRRIIESSEIRALAAGAG